jgi:hypothetical protein
MKYTVTWISHAEDQLADLWNRAADQQAVADSANRLERELGIDADKKGVPMGRFRALYDNPLAVLFIVDPGDCMVKVIQVRRI